MGRTYEALSHGRTKRVSEDVNSVPPTAFLPIFQPAAQPPAEHGSEVDGEPATSDTALLDDLSKDHDDIPFVEVGGPRGKRPQFGPQVDPTPVPNPTPLKLGHAPPAKEKPSDEESLWSVAFFPLPDEGRAAGGRVASDLVVFHRPDHPISANYRGLLSGIESQQQSGSKPLLIFMTVGLEMEASSTVLNLAIARAREKNRSTLVIEANHERPLIASRLGIASLPGLRELLNRSIPMSVALHSTAQSNLFVLPPGDPEMPVSSEAEARLPSIVEQLRKRFDWVLVNGPEWGSGGAAEWAGLGDSVYLVVRSEQWDQPEVEGAHEAIVKAGGKLRGYVTLQKP